MYDPKERYLLDIYSGKLSVIARITGVIEADRAGSSREVVLLSIEKKKAGQPFQCSKLTAKHKEVSFQRGWQYSDVGKNINGANG